MLYHCDVHAALQGENAKKFIDRGGMLIWNKLGISKSKRKENRKNRKREDRKTKSKNNKARKQE